MSNIIEDTFVLKDIQTNKDSHEELCKLANFTFKTHADKIILDMSNVQFIAANQFAILGSILDTFKQQHSEKKIVLHGLQKNIIEIIGKNGFYKHLINTKKIPDKYNTVIPYKIFKFNEINEYQKYLTINLFNRNDLPKMSGTVRDYIQDYLLEAFKNAIDHTHGKYIYTCGQFFPKSSLLFFTLVDIGETIRYNVDKYHKKNHKCTPSSALQWAMQPGNTTLDNNGPRGLGLSLIQNFVKLNQGYFYIISENENYEITPKGERYNNLLSFFPGTIVTLAFNLDDTAIYTMENESVPDIEF